jgi:hypothetical protein
MRIATYNVEWFTNLFDARGTAVWRMANGRRATRSRAAEQLASLGIVFTAIDADAVMIIEAPDTNGRRRKTVPMLERFAARL